MAFDIRKHIKPGVQVYLIDGFLISAADVQAMKDMGLFPICYFSAGSYEAFGSDRPDRNNFTKADYGNELIGWPGEFWLDIRRDSVKRAIKWRMEMCKAKGFLGVDPDNVDAYTWNTSFPLKPADQLAYNKWLAATAHGLGLAAGLKNDVDQIRELVGDFDYFVNEECQANEECGTYTPAKAALKPVWSVEYLKSAYVAACPKQLQYGIRTLYKADPDLSNDWVECTGVNYPDPDPTPTPSPSPSPSPSPRPSPSPSPGPGLAWRPRASDRLLFNYQPREAFNVTKHLFAGTKVFVIDANTTSAATVAAIKAKGLFPVCYFSAGTAFRTTSTSVSDGLLARDYGTRAQGQYWYVDITSTRVRAAVKKAIEGCKAKGFVGTAPADMDTFEKNHGFMFGAAQQLAFNRFIANMTRGLGLAAGLTNDVDQVAALAPTFDFFVSERCIQRQDCDVYRPAVTANKPVFHIEYSSAYLATACKCQSFYGITTIQKLTALTSWRAVCPRASPPPTCPFAR